MTSQVVGPLAPTEGATVLRPIGVDGVTISGGFWAERQAANAAVSIPEGWEQLHRAGNVRNLQRAAGGGAGEAIGEVFADSDVQKWLEAAAWEIARSGDATLLEQQRELTAIVAAVQADLVGGAADVAVETRDAELLATLDRSATRTSCPSTAPTPRAARRSEASTGPTGCSSRPVTSGTPIRSSGRC